MRSFIRRAVPFAAIAVTAALTITPSLAHAPSIAAPGTPFAPPPATPDAGRAAETFVAARRWLDGGARDPSVATPSDVHAAAVVLRRNGRTVGRGLDAGTPERDGCVDRALRAALEDARARIGAGAGEADPALLTLELELAGPREPLVGRTFQDALRGIEPGACGLMLADRDRTAYLPASHLLARRMASPLSRAVVSLVSELGLPARDLPGLQELGGATAIYASWSVRLAQRTPEAAPEVMARLVPPAPLAPVDRADAQALAEGIVALLERWAEPPALPEGVPAEAREAFARGGLRGTYRLTADLHEPLIAPPAEQALAAFALANAARTEGWPAALRERSRALAERVLAALDAVDSTEVDPVTDIAATAYASLAIDALGPSGTVPASLRQRVSAALEAQCQPAAFASLRVTDRAPVLAAAAARLAAGAAVLPRETLMPRLRAEWDAMNAANAVTAGPWLLHANALLLSLGEESSLGADAAAMLEAACEVLRGTQVRTDPSRPTSLLDEVGAFPVTGSAAGRVSSQSLRAHLVLAMAGRSPADPAALGWAGRYVRQLAIGPSAACMAPNPAAARGGILASTADPVLPVPAQAMALWALSESDRAWGRAAADRPGASPAP